MKSEREPQSVAHNLGIGRGRWRLSHPVTCAWCGRVRIAGHWFGKPRELEVVAHVGRRASSGICPSCFADLAPGRDYRAPGD
jgi:hypothetical protein